MADECTCEASEVLLFPCSGGSNCGQIANQVAVKLTEEGIGNIYCLSGIGAHESIMLDTTRAARRVVAIDGCTVACAKKTIEHAGITVTDWVCVTEEGVAKTHEFKLVPSCESQRNNQQLFSSVLPNPLKGHQHNGDYCN